jgi:hypothetical protein
VMTTEQGPSFYVKEKSDSEDNEDYLPNFQPNLFNMSRLSACNCLPSTIFSCSLLYTEQLKALFGAKISSSA